MSIYFLDTTTITLLRHGNSNIQKAIHQHAGDTVAITSVNVDEYLSGWYTLLRRARDHAAEASASLDLAGAMRLLARFPVLPVTEASLNRTDQPINRSTGQSQNQRWKDGPQDRCFGPGTRCHRGDQ